MTLERYQIPARLGVGVLMLRETTEDDWVLQCPECGSTSASSFLFCEYEAILRPVRNYQEGTLFIDVERWAYTEVEEAHRRQWLTCDAPRVDQAGQTRPCGHQFPLPDGVTIDWEV